MKNVLSIFLLLVMGFSVFGQEETESPFVVEKLNDKESLLNILGLEGFLFKTDLDKPNTSDYIYYGLSLKKVEKEFPYIIKNGPEGKQIDYVQFIPILIEALEETNDLFREEEVARMKLEQDYANYKIMMENQLSQVHYQLQRLQSEMDGLNASKSVEQQH